MENKENTAAAATATAEAYPSFLSPTSSSSAASSPPPSPPVILSPCAACKILRRRCVVEKCMLAPYFPPTEPIKFTTTHRVFGASNIIKLLQELPESKRADGVKSMVYEANVRLRDPVYGCAGAISQLQKQVNELQAELAKAQAQIFNLKCQNANLFEFITCCKHDHHDIKMAAAAQEEEEGPINNVPYIDDENNNNSAFFLDETILGVAWEPLWT